MRIACLVLVGCVAGPVAQESSPVGVAGEPLAQTAAKLVFAPDFTQHREGVLAAGGTVETGDQIEQRGLTRARAAQQG